MPEETAYLLTTKELFHVADSILRRKAASFSMRKN